MRDALQSYLTVAGGLTEVTRQRALAAARGLVAQGEATAEQVQTLAEDLLTQTRQNRETVTALVRYEVERSLGRLGLASGDELAQLVDRVRTLEEQVRAQQRAEVTPPVAAPAKAAKTDKAAAAKKTGKAPKAGKAPRTGKTPVGAASAPAKAPPPPAATPAARSAGA